MKCFLKLPGFGAWSDLTGRWVNRPGIPGGSEATEAWSHGSTAANGTDVMADLADMARTERSPSAKTPASAPSPRKCAGTRRSIGTPSDTEV